MLAKISVIKLLYNLYFEDIFIDINDLGETYLRMIGKYRPKNISPFSN